MSANDIKVTCLSIALCGPVYAWEKAGGEPIFVALLILAVYIFITFDIGIRPEDRDE